MQNMRQHRNFVIGDKSRPDLNAATRNMATFIGFSGWAIPLCGLLIAFITIHSITKSSEKAMLIEITEEQYS